MLLQEFRHAVWPKRIAHAAVVLTPALQRARVGGKRLKREEREEGARRRLLRKDICSDVCSARLPLHCFLAMATQRCMRCQARSCPTLAATRRKRPGLVAPSVSFQGTRCPSSPAATRLHVLVWIRPQQVAEQPRVWHVGWPRDPLDLLQALELRREAAMHAQDLGRAIRGGQRDPRSVDRRPPLQAHLPNRAIIGLPCPGAHVPPCVSPRVPPRSPTTARPTARTFSSTSAATGRQLKQSVKVFHSLML